MKIKTEQKRRSRPRSSRKKKILSPHSHRVLQDLADADRQLIASSLKRTISELKEDSINVAPRPVRRPHRFMQFFVADDKILHEKKSNTSFKPKTELPSSVYSELQKTAKRAVQQMPQESRRAHTRFPTLASPNGRPNGRDKQGAKAAKFVNEGMRSQFQDTRLALAREKCPKPEPQPHNENPFRPSTSGRSGYWRGYVHNLNYSQMRNSHTIRKAQATAKAEKQLRKRSGKSFSILTLTNSSHWTPKTAIMKVPYKAKKVNKVRTITCFNCGKPGHKLVDCPDLKDSEKCAHDHDHDQKPGPKLVTSKDVTL